MQLLRWIATGLVMLVVAAILAGQLGWLQGKPPATLGLHDGRLAPPSTTPNSVSSQAALYPDHPRHAEAQIEPLHYRGDGAAAMARLEAAVAAMPHAQVQTRAPGYLYATFSTPLMRYVDDVEFALDPSAPGVIQLRSASRIGHGDWGVNRKRIEDIRARFAASASG
jgi:uncharacterized protein (DUF1499 family)